MANLSASDDYFRFFGIHQQFNIDLPALDQAYLAIQKEVHPDRHARGSEAEQRLAMQMATLANTAYQTLKNPIQRGLYLCQLNGVNAMLETNTAMPAAFLMKQMEWREALDDAHEAAQLEALHDEVQHAHQASLQQCGQLIDAAHDLQAAAQQVRALMFIERFLRDIEDRLDQIDA